MSPNYCYAAKVVRVIDGDTFEVEVDLGFRMTVRLPLRLAHVDAPERGTPAGVTTAKHVASLLGALPSAVTVRTFKPADKYGRYLADVFLDTSAGQMDLGHHLVVLELASRYEGGKR